MAQTVIQRHHLGNGLTLLGEACPSNQSAAIGFFVKTGARDETPKEAGISHFLEHMMFKGTKKRSALDVTYHLGNIGAQANAYTSEENTVYYAAILPEYFSDMQELLSDMLRPALEPAEFDTEKKVILEEIALYQDRPQFYLFMEAMFDYFGGHTAGNRVLGTTESVSAISRDDMQAYFDRRYAPSNVTLVATGRFDWERFVADAERYCSAWQDHKVERKIERHQDRGISKTYRRKNLNQSHLVYLVHGPSAQEEERYPFNVLTTIIGDAAGSKLYWKLINSGLAESAGADCDEKDGTGCCLVHASMEPTKIDQVGAIIKETLSKPLDFSSGDLERAKTKLMAKVVLSGELPMGRLMALGNEWIYRRTTVTLHEIIAKLKAIELSDIQEALEKYPLKGWSEFRLEPE